MLIIEYWYWCIHRLLIATMATLREPSTTTTIITLSGHHVTSSLPRCLACVWRTSLILLHTGALCAAFCGKLVPVRHLHQHYLQHIQVEL